MLKEEISKESKEFISKRYHDWIDCKYNEVEAVCRVGIFVLKWCDLITTEKGLSLLDSLKKQTKEL